MKKNLSEICCPNYHWFKGTVVILGMLLLFGVVSFSILRDRLVNDPQFQLPITGQGKVSYQPDIATINIGVQVDKVAKADEALNQLNDKMTKIFQAIQEAGVGKADIQTQNYSLYPQYDYSKDNNPELAGYNANQIISVKVRNLVDNSGLIAKVISQATQAGANQINGVSFEASNLNELKQQARLKAIADAQAKKGIIAANLGVRLGKIVGMWENVTPMADLSAYGKGGVGGSLNAASPVVPEGSQELIVEVTINYKIK
ncbi:MAG: SIMPL domain-containing protein [Candidatus Buchananbacteria bacterium]